MGKNAVWGSSSRKHPTLASAAYQKPLILHSVALDSTENPLRIASIAGHIDFVKEILRLKPEFTKELNQDGFSPMHLASANGHLEIVRELLKVDKRLCQLEGREEKNPLHYAATKGKVDVNKWNAFGLSWVCWRYDCTKGDSLAPCCEEQPTWSISFTDMGERDEKGGHLELEGWARQYNSSPSNLEKTTPGKYISVSLSFAVLSKNRIGKLYFHGFICFGSCGLADHNWAFDHFCFCIYIFFWSVLLGSIRAFYFILFYFFKNHEEHLTWGPATGGSLTGLITKLMGWSHYSTNATNL